MRNDLMVHELDILTDTIEKTHYTVYKDYLHELDQMEVLVPDDGILTSKVSECVRLLHLKKLACVKDEDIFQKLSTVYHAVLTAGASLILMIDVKDKDAPVDFYIGVRAEEKIGTPTNTLRAGMVSNFPGTIFENVSNSSKAENNMTTLFEGIFAGNPVISSVSTVASARDKQKTEHKNFVQGIERLIDAMKGRAYTALFLADAFDKEEIAVMRANLEQMYTALSPYAKSVWSYSENNSTSVMKSLNVGFNYGTTETESEGSVETTSTTTPKVLAAAPLGLGAAIAGLARLGQTSSKKCLGNRPGSLGGILDSGLGKVGSAANSTSTSIAKNTSYSTAVTLGANLGVGSSTTDSLSEGRTVQIENQNKTVQEILKRIEEQLKRIQESENYGLFNCGTYFIAPDRLTSELAANTYQALMIGDGSFVESSAINVWKDSRQTEPIKEYLKRCIQPVLVKPWDEKGDYYKLLSAGTMVSGLELPLHLSFPLKSVPGLPVVEYAEFGRNAKMVEKGIPLGKIYHMGSKESGVVDLDCQSLTAHAFVTGSTGAGKSNTVYHMLEGLQEKGIKFLVIEPAKGEYKHAFGGKKGMSVYGTNQKKSPLLRLNPFSFPEDIHVLEHMDRLVEIFNACWPMYAAMPAVLKDAIEQAYRRKGWDMTSSECHPRIFPTFADLMEELPRIISSSAYSEDTKGDYVGSLVTRIKSLTNGINGQIFCSFAELTGEELFDRNVIVDISRVGSMETKSLIMGILVMKLQEYRMASEGANRELQHVTVLEEAHHLLRRTSSAQSQESSNLQGKSVEMIANAIAEMRTYGEGFIIADQAPGLMDESVIRNTNTKIILRLPDEADRILVGKSAALKEKQVEELAKLPVGVAAVYQNDWLEAVLCQVDLFESDEPFVYEWNSQEQDFSDFFKAVFDLPDYVELSEEKAEQVDQWIDHIMDENIRNLFKKVRNGQELSVQEKCMITYNFFEGKYLAEILEVTENEREGLERVKQKICSMHGVKDVEVADAICQNLLRTLFDLCNMPVLQERYEKYLLGGRIF